MKLRANYYVQRRGDSLLYRRSMGGAASWVGSTDEASGFHSYEGAKAKADELRCKVVPATWATKQPELLR